MSDTNNVTNPGGGTGSPDDLDAAWGGRPDREFGAPDDGGHFSSVEKPPLNTGVDDANNSVVDVAETVKAKKSSSPVGMIIAGGLGLLVLGVAGYIGMTLYNKLVPAKPSYQETDRSMGLPDVQAPTQGGMLIPGGDTPNAVDVQRAVGSASPDASTPGASIAGDGQEVVAQTTPSSVDAPVQAVAAAATTAAVSTASAGREPQKAVQIQTAPVEPVKQVAAEVICPVAEAKPAAKKKAAPTARSQATAGASEKRRKQNQSSKVAKKKPQKGSDKKTATGSETAKEVVASDTSKPRSTGSLQGYKLMSIWPKTGEFQQATVKDPNGANHVVRAGDRIAGVRVQSVNAASYEVETEAGFIR